MTLTEARASGARIWRRTVYSLTTLTVLALLAGIAAPIGLLVWRDRSPSVVLEQGSAGILRAVQVHTSFVVSGTVTHLTTSVGDITTHGAFSGPHGTALVIQRTNKMPGVRVCAVDPPIACARLVGTWAGPMHPAPAAGHAVDFVQEGFTEDNLDNWLELGIVGLCFVALFWVMAFLIRDNCRDNDNPEDNGAVRRT